MDRSFSLLKAKRKMPHSEPKPEAMPEAHSPPNEPATSTSVKFSGFLSRPLSASSLDQVPGIGLVTVENFKLAKITKPAQIFGYFLFVDQNVEEFKNFLKTRGLMREPHLSKTIEAFSQFAKNIV